MHIKLLCSSIDAHSSIIVYLNYYFTFKTQALCPIIQLQQISDQQMVKFIPLRAKRVGEFIEIRHKKISPTRILSTLEVCHSVTLWPINPQLYQLSAMGLGRNFF